MIEISGDLQRTWWGVCQCSGIQESEGKICL